MVDIHCHILPKLDDGAADLSESMAMVRLAADSGVRAIAATPHFRGEADSLKSLPKIVSRLNRLRKAIESEGIDLQLIPGAEILCTPDTPKLAQQGSLPTIGNSRYILTEFYFDETLEFMEGILDQFILHGYIPVVAHPERYEAVQKRPQKLQRWFAKGYVLQLNKGSILGAFGSRPEATARLLLRDGLAHIIASDAHHCDYRTPHMTQIRSWAEENLGAQYARILLEQNPARIISGKPMVPIE